MAYTTTDKVRIEAGIVGNTNIATTSITNKITRADAIVNGKIADVYSLPLAETPGLIEQLSTAIAGALILIDEYGKEAQGTDKDGFARLETAMDTLEQIRTKKLKVISDTTGTELAVANTLSPKFRPTNLSSDENESDPDVATHPKFKINKIF